MKHSVTLLILNGYLSMLSCCAFAIFGYYLIKNYKAGYHQMRPAIALAVLWLGEIILRFPLFLTRAQLEAGYVVPAPTAPLIVGGFITVTALLCIIRVFSPSQWGNKSWLSAFVLSTLVVGITLKIIISS